MMRARRVAEGVSRWMKRCGVRCGEQFNAVVAPIAGVRYEAR